MTDDKAGARSSPEPEVGSGRSGRSGRFWRGRLLRGFGGLAITALALGLGLFAWLHEPRPTGETGARAEALAARVEAAVDIAAWRKTGAVSWVFGGRHRHLWDRERHIALVEWGDERALVKLDTRTGRAWRGGVELEGAAAEAVVAKGYAHWANDSFWLNAPAKLRDDGVTLALVDSEAGEGPALLVEYGRGGVTPGDAYLWELDAEGRPKAWRMWVSIIPIGGLGATWEDWVTLPTGARVATRHRIAGLLDLRLTEVEAARDLETLRPDQRALFRSPAR